MVSETQRGDSLAFEQLSSQSVCDSHSSSIHKILQHTHTHTRKHTCVHVYSTPPHPPTHTHICMIVKLVKPFCLLSNFLFSATFSLMFYTLKKLLLKDRTYASLEVFIATAHSCSITTAVLVVKYTHAIARKTE